jgi:hypothetical protein
MSEFELTRREMDMVLRKPNAHPDPALRITRRTFLHRSLLTGGTVGAATGDAIVPGAMPKSAFAANSQAKVCAFAIASALTGSERVAPRLFNTCFTFLAPDDAVSDAISFKITEGTTKIADIFISKIGESAETRAQTAREAEGWYAAFMYDMFG